MEQTLREISGLQPKMQRGHSQLDKFTGTPMPETPPLATCCHDPKEGLDLFDLTTAQTGFQSDILGPTPAAPPRQKTIRKQAKRRLASGEAPQLPLFECLEAENSPAPAFSDSLFCEASAGSNEPAAEQVAGGSSDNANDAENADDALHRLGPHEVGLDIKSEPHVAAVGDDEAELANSANSASAVEPCNQTDQPKKTRQRAKPTSTKIKPVVAEPPDPYSLSAASLHAIIDGWTDMHPSQRAPLHTAVRHAEKLLTEHRSRLGAAAPWSCAGLNRALWKGGTRAVTMKHNPFRNMVTSLRTILIRLGLHALSRKGMNDLSPAWQALFEDLPTDDRRKGLVRLFRYLTLMGITPETVTAQAISDFYIWCDTQILHEDAAGLVRRSAGHWEDMRKANQPNWPVVQFHWEGMRDHYALPLSAYPQSFNDELELFLNDDARLGTKGSNPGQDGANPFATLAAIYAHKKQLAEQIIRVNTGGSFGQTGEGHSPDISAAGPNGLHHDTAQPFGDLGGYRGNKKHSARRNLRRRSERTIETRRWQIKVAASALVLSGFPIEKVTSLSVLVWPVDNAMTILDFHRNRTIQRLSEKGEDFGPEDVRSSNLKGIGEVLRQIAKFRTNMPDGDLDDLDEAIASVSPFTQLQMTDKNHRRLKALLDDPVYSKLLNLPQYWMKLAREPGRDKLEAARFAMYAAALEILLFLPLRRHNLLELKLDGTLRRPAPGKLIDEIYLPAQKVKNNREIRWLVDPISAKLLEDYITQFRPLLAKPGNNYLFPGILDDHRDEAEFGHELSERVALDIGAEFNCHLARHFAVVRFLRDHPGSYETAANILGHKSIETTRRFYCGLEIDAVARVVNDTLMAERRVTKIIAQGAYNQPHRIRPKKDKLS